MLAWILENKEWLFSGVAVAVLGGIGRWLCSKQGKKDQQSGPARTSTYSVQQTHSGSGDNVGGDKIVKG